jgi:ribosomal protein L31
MKKLITSFLAVVCAYTLIAQPNTIENVDYGTTAGDLTGQTGSSWIAHSASGTNPVQYVTSPLTFSGYNSSGVGGSIEFGNGSGSREDVNFPIATPLNSGSVYLSFMMSVSSVTGAGDYSVHLMECATNNCTSYRPRFTVKPSSTTDAVDLGLVKSGAASTADWGTDDAIPYNQTFLVVIKYTFIAGTGNDPAVAYIFTGSIPTTEPTTADLTAPDVTGTDAATIAAIGVRQGSTGTSALAVDGFRVADSWANLELVTPYVADPVTGVNFTGTTYNSTTLNWSLPTSYLPAGNTVLVFLKDGSAITAGTPTANIATYTADADFGGTGTAYENDNNAKCVYKGDGTSINITGLSASTTYHAIIYVVADGTTLYSTDVTANETTSAPPADPIVSFKNATLSVSEGGTSLTFFASIANPNANPTSVTVTAYPATAGTNDYTFAPATITFAGSSSADESATITINDDNLVEGDETFVLVLSNPTNNALIGVIDSLEVTITDNDFSSFELGATTYSVTEGVDDSAFVTVKYNNRGPNPTSITLGATNGTATQGANNDFVFTNQTITFNDANDSVRVVGIKIVDRNPYESNEQFTVSLSNPTNNATLGVPFTAIVDIANRASYPTYTIGQVNKVDANGVCDSLGKRYTLSGTVYGINLRTAGLEFAFRDQTGGIRVFNATGNTALGYGTVAEGDSLVVIGQIDQYNGLAEINFIDTIINTNAKGTVHLPKKVTTLGESEESDLVYFTNVTFITPTPVWNAAGSGTNFPVTNGIDTFDIRIVPTAMVDIVGKSTPTSAFTLVGIGGQFDATLPRTDGYQFFPRGIADIISVGPSISFSGSANTVAENVGTVSVDVLLQDPIVLPTDVTVAVTGGTATLGTDYTFTTANLYFAPGASTPQTITVTIIDDAVFESDETIELEITTVSSPGMPGAISKHTITITNNDANSVREIDARKTVNVYPNPSAGIFNITSENIIKQVIVTDMTGKTVFTTTGIKENSTVINIDQLPAGIYMLQVFENDNTYPVTKRITKK